MDNNMVNIIKDYVPINTYHRDGVKLRKFRGVTIHETGNTSKGATALAHRNFAHNLVKNNTPTYIGYHYFVDDKESYLVTPTDERVWINGDGNTGTGNNETVSIEICVNSDGAFDKAVSNACWLTAYVLNEHGIVKVVDGIKDKINGNLFQHFSWSGKNCPQNIRASGIWDNFVSKVQIYLDEMREPPIKAETFYFKINTDYNNGLWNATQKGAFPYLSTTPERDLALEKAIEYYVNNNLSKEYKIFDTKDGRVVYPLPNPNNDSDKDESTKLQVEIKNLKVKVSELNTVKDQLLAANQEYATQIELLNNILAIKTEAIKKAIVALSE